MTIGIGSAYAGLEGEVKVIKKFLEGRLMGMAQPRGQVI